MKLYDFPKVHFTKDDLKPLLEKESKPLLEKESKPKNNCKIDYLNDLGFVAFREEYNVKNVHEARQQALFRKRFFEVNKIKLTGVHITFDNVKTYVKF